MVDRFSQLNEDERKFFADLIWDTSEELAFIPIRTNIKLNGMIKMYDELSRLNGEGI